VAWKLLQDVWENEPDLLAELDKPCSKPGVELPPDDIAGFEEDPSHAENLVEDNRNILIDAVLCDVAGESARPWFAKMADGGLTCIADIEDLDTMAFKELDEKPEVNEG
jgi:hypothetical protein